MFSYFYEYMYVQFVPELWVYYYILRPSSPVITLSLTQDSFARFATLNNTVFLKLTVCDCNIYRFQCKIWEDWLFPVLWPDKTFPLSNSHKLSRVKK